MTADAKTEMFRRAALFLGAWLLGVQCGTWFYSSGDASGLPLVFALGFALVGVLCALQFGDRLLRAAWIVFAIQYALLAPPIFRGSSAAPRISGALTATFAILLVWAGARKRSRVVLAAAAAVFVAAIVFKVVVTEHLRWVLGGRSIMSL